jgi:ribosomal protein S18 acetylase RimI-like enzyme
MPRPSAVEIRPARAEDLPALGKLGAELARAHHRWDPDRFFLAEPMEDGYAWWLGKELANARAVVLAAVRGERVVGYAYGRIERRDWNALRDRCGAFIDLIVEPDARGEGAGRRLSVALVEALEAMGAPRVVLSTASRNRTAQRLFRALGFRPTMVEMTREAGPSTRSAGARRQRNGGRAAHTRAPAADRAPRGKQRRCPPGNRCARAPLPARDGAR